MFSGVFTQRHCLIEQFSGLLMATPTGLEPVASSVTGWRDTLLHQGAKFVPHTRLKKCVNLGL